MLDLKRTLELIQGAIFDPDRTWERYKAEAEDWQKTAFLLTGPLIVGSQLLGFLLGLIFGGPFAPTLGGMLMSIVSQTIAAFAIAFIAAILAGLFKGKNSFPLALAATSLAFVPGYVGGALLWIPVLGIFITLGMLVYGLVLLWRILPVYLDIPATARVGHYILTLVGALLTMFLLVRIVGPSYVSKSGWDVGGGDRPAGLFGEMERHGRILEAAEEDTYDPPRSGELSKSQVEDYIRVMTKTRDYRIEQTQELKALSEKADADEIESLGEVFSGMSGVVGLTTAEMEVVKTGGGNWAEHQWVKEQLRVARIQKDINDAVKHNYELYRKFEDELQQLDNY